MYMKKVPRGNNPDAVHERPPPDKPWWSRAMIFTVAALSAALIWGGVNWGLAVLWHRAHPTPAQPVHVTPAHVTPVSPALIFPLAPHTVGELILHRR